MSHATKMTSPGVKARAVRMVRERREDYPSVTAASAAVAKRVGLGRDTVRRWLVDRSRAGRDRGLERPAPSMPR